MGGWASFLLPRNSLVQALRVTLPKLFLPRSGGGGFSLSDASVTDIILHTRVGDAESIYLPDGRTACFKLNSRCANCRRYQWEEYVVAKPSVRNFQGTSLFPATTNAGHDHELGTYTFDLIPHTVGLVVQ